MFRVIISSLLAVAALFVGFFPHYDNSCKIFSILTPFICPGWTFHIIFGSFLYILAVLISQSTGSNVFYTSSDTLNTIKEHQIL